MSPTFLKKSLKLPQTPGHLSQNPLLPSFPDTEESLTNNPAARQIGKGKNSKLCSLKSKSSSQTTIENYLWKVNNITFCD